MKECISCKESMRQCMDTHTFAFAHLYNDEKAMDMHIHDCYEIYYSISGGKQFLIDNYFYDISDGDIFLINQFESHYLTQIDQQKHERIILSIDPEYLKQISTEKTDLNHCFQFRGTDTVSYTHLNSVLICTLLRQLQCFYQRQNCQRPVSYTHLANTSSKISLP